MQPQNLYKVPKKHWDPRKNPEAAKSKVGFKE